MDIGTFLRKLLNQGVAGDERCFYEWGKMLFEIFRKPLPENFSDFLDHYETEKQYMKPYLSLEFDKLWTINAVNNLLQKAFQEGEIEKIEPYGEYRQKKELREITYEDVFFVSRDFSFCPLQYIRSRVGSFCEMHRFHQESQEELLIVVTEAAENAIKYSSISPIYISQKIKGDFYELFICNAVGESDLIEEIEQGKFPRESSLMRGVLVMSRLMDALDIRRNPEKSRVELFARKKVMSFTL
ncbi:MAG: ATP-binding protein [Leptospiraceae bacterium]|nr:ATP-binding protein [Leptospiraceae bacterium]MDW8307236.1 hypothetical protein [Leptospiraceae bacterium]